MIVTCKGRIPFLWILFAALPWSAGLLKFLVMGGVFIFSLKKFVENPAGLTLILSLPGIISLGLRPFVNFMSDRIWTRFGRRKPFVTAGWMGAILCIGLMPVMPNFWALLGIYMLYNIFNDLGDGPMEALKQEVVPPRQRGTSTAIGTWIFNFALLTFNLVAIGRFDDYKFMAGVPLTGEQSIYWSTCAAMAMMLLLITLGIRELNPQSKLRGERFSLRTFFRSILNRNLWPVYLLITGYAILNAGLGPMNALLYTEQWQFTKQEMGYNFVIGGTINIFLIALIGLFADRLPRMKAYQILMVLSLLINVSFYLYVHHVLYDRTPTLVEVVVFGEALSIIGILMGMIYTPLVYDYVPRNEMGTYAAGAALTGRITSFFTLNGVGLFIWLHATVFLPPGGEMTRVTFARPHTTAEVEAVVAASGLASASPDGRLTAEPWYATRAALDHGRCFELRAENSDSLTLRKRRDAADQKRNGLLAEETNERGFADAAARNRDTAAQQRHADAAEALRQEAAPLAAEVESLDAELKRRADAFQTRTVDAFAPHLLRDGDQVRAAFTVPVVLVDYPLQTRPATRHVEALLSALRQQRPDLLDLRLVHRNDRWALSACLETSGPAGSDPVPSFTAALAAEGGRRLGRALPTPLAPGAPRTATATGLDVLVLEDPLNRYPSPITRVVYRIMDAFGDAPRPEQRVWAIARSLRVPGRCEHASVRQADDGENALRVVAVYAAGQATSTTDPVIAERLRTLLPGIADPDMQPFADLYQRLVPAAAQNRTTVARPVITASFSTMKYDYMSGYIWMLFLGLIGLGITVMFARREEKGLIRKRGREEADAEQAAEEQAEAREHQGSPEAVHYYTPGFFWAKVVMILFSLVLIGAGFLRLGPDLQVMLFGQRTQAEAVRVVKQKPGGPGLVLASDAEVRAAEERQDRSYVFWNEYQFQLADGRRHIARAPSGSQLKPGHYLLDEDGLPTTVTLFYDSANPDRVVLPGAYSTWFVPGTLGGFGLLGFISGCVLLYHARRRIALPVLTPATTNP